MQAAQTSPRYLGLLHRLYVEYTPISPFPYEQIRLALKLVLLPRFLVILAYLFPAADRKVMLRAFLCNFDLGQAPKLD